MLGPTDMALNCRRQTSQDLLLRNAVGCTCDGYRRAHQPDGTVHHLQQGGRLADLERQLHCLDNSSAS
jgi:hypothetical protein